MIELTEKEQEARKKVCLALDVPTVEKGLEKTIDWISQHLHRYKTGRYNI